MTDTPTLNDANKELDSVSVDKAMEADYSELDSLDLKTAVKNAVLNKLGLPPDLYRVDAKNLYDNYWRVNIWCKVAQQAKDKGFWAVEVQDIIVAPLITHSYFLQVSPEGGIIGVWDGGEPIKIEREF